MTEFKSFYKKAEVGRCHYPTRLDTYGCGCAHNCSYCYARSLLAFRKLWNPQDPKVVDLAKVERRIAKIAKDGEPKIVRLGGMTDCFQPCEKERRATYETIKLLNHYKVGYLIVTKSAMVADDEYMRAMDKRLAHIQITVTTLDDEKSRGYEKASDPSDRVKAILKLQEAGFDVAIRLSPLIPELMDFDKLNSLGIEKAVVEFLRVNSWIKKWFDVDYSKYSLSSGGYMHLPLEDKKEILKKVRIPSVTVCEDVPEHYEYWKMNVNPNPDDCCNLRNECEMWGIRFSMQFLFNGSKDKEAMAQRLIDDLAEYGALIMEAEQKALPYVYLMFFKKEDAEAFYEKHKEDGDYKKAMMRVIKEPAYVPNDMIGRRGR